MSDEPAPRPAATVVVLRPTGEQPSAPGFEVFVLRRVATMAFAPSMTVFPGGGVDPTDRQPTPWIGRPPSWFAHRLGLTGPDAVDLAQRLVVAAVRELWEETGLLLAVPTDVPAGLGPDGNDRPSLARLLTDRGLALAADALRPWANWVTPCGRPRRYDTTFFVAALPAGAGMRVTTTEAEAGYWTAPAELLAADGGGSVRLMPPTRAVLVDLARHPSVAAVLAAEPVVVPWTRDAGGATVRHMPVTSAPESR